jgi:Acetyltransferase (GNAT) domain
VNVCSVDPLADSRWPAFVGAHPRASVFHSRGWLEALRRTYNYSPVAYTTSIPGQRLENAIVACEIRSWLTGRRLVSLPFADHCELLADDPLHREALLAELVRGVETRRWRSIELRPLAPDVPKVGREDQEVAFCFHSLDLRPSLDELFGRFHKDSIQRKIRRAEREGVQVVSGASEAQLESFYRLLLLTRRRHHIPPQPIAWFRHLLDCMGDQFTISVASKDGRAVAAIVLLRHGDTLVYKYGASDASVHNLGAMPLLFWHVLRDGKQAGARSLDLGRTDLDNPGLMTFKDRLGAARSDLRYVRYPSRAATRSGARWGATIARHLVAQMPDRLLVATGRLLYRHFG